MEKTTIDRQLALGVLLIALSGAFYVLELIYFQESSDIFSTSFFVHYGMALVYFGYLWISKGIRFIRLFSAENWNAHALLLILFNLSAYSLNKSIVVFSESVHWLSILLCIENLILILMAISTTRSSWLTSIVSFVLAVSLLLNFYLLIMTLPFWVFGALGAFLLGCSLLVFVPVFYLICILSFLRKMQWTRTVKMFFILGLCLSMICTAVYLISWKRIESKVLMRSITMDAPYQHQTVPNWVEIAQSMEINWLTEAYLKSGTQYQKIPPFNELFSMSGFNNSQWNKHDPLVAISASFNKRNDLDEKAKIKILNFLYESRHHSAERYWTGANLTTDLVVTNLEIFASERLCFVEQIVTVVNNRVDQSRRWPNQQEAVYTFQLPEGGVITSLSLWVNGEEEKGILTSKGKAETAYTSIVSVERRDPSVVYWLEGNQVLVRVFPVTPLDNRKFKLGITAPLEYKNNQLRYQPITFQGPDFSSAKAAVNIVLHGTEITNSDLKFTDQGSFLTWNGSYSADWGLNFVPEPIKPTTFSFLGQHFKMVESQKLMEKFHTKHIYLDLSNNWVEEDLANLAAILAKKKITVLGSSHASISADELTSIDLQKLPNFSLFPFHKVADTNAVILTKGGIKSPNLKDLEGSRFHQDLFSYLSKLTTPIRVVDIGKSPSDYMKSLKEFGVINHQSMSLSELKQLLETDVFPKYQNSNQQVEIPGTSLSIMRIEEAGEEGGSDHLLRLFYYQQILHSIGNRYFNENSISEEPLLEMASTANVVTPLSSLVVLESMEDYERFEIEAKDNSLGNAAITNSGAVPEPHEWALISIGLLLLLLFYKESLRKGLGL